MPDPTRSSDVLKPATPAPDFRTPDGFREFYDNTAGSLQEFLLRRCHGNEEEAQELTQETFIQAWLGREKFQGRSSLSTWVFGIAVNLWRKKCRQRKFAVLDETFEIAAPTPEPAEELSQSELSMLIAQSIANLPADWRVVFRLVRQDGKSYAETAAELRLTENTVRMRLHRATLQLAEDLAQYRELLR